ncbi:hypothetical protein D3C87_1432770 [compost metagenome]
MFVGKPFHQAHTEPHGKPLVAFRILLTRGLQRAIEAAVIDTDRAHLHAMIARIAHDLRRGVKPHGL